jgi:hypothetical protein
MASGHLCRWGRKGLVVAWRCVYSCAPGICSNQPDAMCVADGIYLLSAPGATTLRNLAALRCSSWRHHSCSTCTYQCLLRAGICTCAHEPTLLYPCSSRQQQHKQQQEHTCLISPSPPPPSALQSHASADDEDPEVWKPPPRQLGRQSSTADYKPPVRPRLDRLPYLLPPQQ